MAKFHLAAGILYRGIRLRYSRVKAWTREARVKYCFPMAESIKERQLAFAQLAARIRP
jgi:hypothetical protein